MFPIAEVEFTKSGEIHDSAQVDELDELISGNDVTDLLVLSHGWNNDLDEARSMYMRLLSNFDKRIAVGQVNVAKRRFGVLAVMWPSKKFTEDDLIASGAASLDGGLGDDVLAEAIRELRGGFDADDADILLDELAALVPDLEDSPRAQKDFVALALGLLSSSHDQEVASDVPEELAEMDGDLILNRLGEPDFDLPVAGYDDQLVTAAGVGSFISGVKAGAQKLMNLLTYYQMKDRAGVVGMKGLRALLERIRAGHPEVKLHLVGHSFGARLVTAAVRGADDAARIEVHSLALLQAAFSHNGLAEDYDGEGSNGFFRVVLSDGRVSGPVIITHTVNDRSVGLAYPIASKLGGHDASAIGGSDSIHGGMGRNGAQHTPGTVQLTLNEPGSRYKFASESVSNLRADETIGHHGDVDNVAVADALLSSIAST